MQSAITTSGAIDLLAFAPICEGIVLSHHVHMAALQLNCNPTMGQEILLLYMLITKQNVPQSIDFATFNRPNVANWQSIEIRYYFLSPTQTQGFARDSY